MSRYEPLWKHIKSTGSEQLILSFEQIETVCGEPINHSFLTYKNELSEYGYQVGKISIKNKTVSFSKI